MEDSDRSTNWYENGGFSNQIDEASDHINQTSDQVNENSNQNNFARDPQSKYEFGSGKATVNFPKLRGRENFDEWKPAAKSYLIIRKLWAIIEKPHSPDDYPESNATTISEITLMIEPSLYSYIKDTKSAKKVWDGITKAFDDSGTVRKVTILNQLVSVKLASIGNMEKYINEILLLWNKTKIVGLKIDEQVVASLMLGGLPEEYRAMILGIENSGRKLTVDYVKTHYRV